MDTLDMNSSIQRKQDTSWDQIAKNPTASMWKMATDLKVDHKTIMITCVKGPLHGIREYQQAWEIEKERIDLLINILQQEIIYSEHFWITEWYHWESLIDVKGISSLAWILDLVVMIPQKENIFLQFSVLIPTTRSWGIVINMAQDQLHRSHTTIKV